jgi:broad specificity phosphatase PhoE
MSTRRERPMPTRPEAPTPTRREGPRSTRPGEQVSTRRRIYLLRHAEVAYFDQAGQPLAPDEVPLTANGRRQAEAAGAALAGVTFDRVLTSGLPRTVETARLVAGAQAAVEAWPELRELVPGRLADLPPEELEATFVGAFRGVLPGPTRFLGGETIDQLLDRVLPALRRLLDDPGWDTVLTVLHGGVNRALLSFALSGQRLFLGAIEQAPACINVLDVDQAGAFVVRAVNATPWDPAYLAGRSTTMEELWAQYQGPGRLDSQGPAR